MQPSTHLPESVHAMVYQLIGKKDDQVIYDASKNSIAVKLAQSLRQLDNPKKSVWEKFLNDLDQELRANLEERSKADLDQVNINDEDG